MRLPAVHVRRYSSGYIRYMLMHAGANTLTLAVPAGGITSGICYDVVRLECTPAEQTLVK
jgi:hypothetical protein